MNPKMPALFPNIAGTPRMVVPTEPIHFGRLIAVTDTALEAPRLFRVKFAPRLIAHARGHVPHRAVRAEGDVHVEQDLVALGQDTNRVFTGLPKELTVVE